MLRLDIEKINLGTQVLMTHGPGQVSVASITQDSRRAIPQSCFAAICGLHADGHSYISDCVQAGSSLILHEKPFDPAWTTEPATASFIQVKDVRRAFSALSALLYGHPSTSMYVIGITGTDGKSTTVSLLHQLLQECGLKAGFLSTVSMHDGITLKKNSLRQSTPEADQIHQRLAEMRDNGCTFAVIEATSHGLSPKTARLADVVFQAGIFTNITHEHLEFHGTFDQYKYDKGELFRRAQAHVILNADDPHSIDMAAQANAPVTWYATTTSIAPSADLWAEEIESEPSGSSFTLCVSSQRYRTSTQLTGEVNIANILAAAAAAHRCADIPPEQLASVIPRLQGPRGRMMRIDHDQPFSLFVDYAHTPGSFEKLLPMLRGITSNRLIIVFGSAGERDTAKRPMQGKIADRYADIIILTDEDPRAEDSMQILKDIAGGISSKAAGENLFFIPDRRSAIEHACKTAQPGDLIITLGKGHEGNIQYADVSIPWDEPEVVHDILSGLGYSRRESECVQQ